MNESTPNAKTSIPEKLIEVNKEELLKENQAVVFGRRYNQIYFVRNEDAGKLDVEDMHSSPFVPKSEWDKWIIVATPRLEAKGTDLIENVEVKSIPDFEKTGVDGNGVWVSYLDLKNKYQDQDSNFVIRKAFQNENPFTPQEELEKERSNCAILVTKWIDKQAYLRSEEKLDDASKIDEAKLGERVILAVDDYIKKYPEKITELKRINEINIQYNKELLKSIKSKLTEKEWEFIDGEHKEKYMEKEKENREKSIWHSKK